MGRFTQKEITYLQGLKRKIVSPHKTCKGVGYIDGVNPCKCMKIFDYIKELYYSKIPQDYWDLNFKDLEIDPLYKKIAGSMIENIDNAIEQGLGLFFTGERGIGKTSLQCEIGKRAVVERYNVYYNIAQNIIDDRFTDDQSVIKRLKSADLILIDELDKVIMREKSNIPKQIENLLRELLPNKKSIILCTNLNEDEVEDKFEIISLIRRYIKIVPMKGKDYSGKKQKQWMDKLKGEMDYFSDNITAMAEEFFKNEQKAFEKEFDSLF